VLGSSIVSKLSLFVMINTNKRWNEVSGCFYLKLKYLIFFNLKDKINLIYRIRWHMLLAIAVCTPYFLSFLSSIQNVLFKTRKGYPHWLVVLWVLVVEMSQTLGTSLFVFKVLTNIPNINALFLMNVTCVFPLIFKIVFASSRGLTRLKKDSYFVT
jgi:hypothetical protein